MAMDWKPDMVNWNCYTPWPFSDLFEELDDKVQVHDYAKYNFVTPIIEPAQMTRDEVLRKVLHNYRHFFIRKTFLFVGTTCRANKGEMKDLPPCRRPKGGSPKSDLYGYCVPMLYW